MRRQHLWLIGVTAAGVLAASVAMFAPERSACAQQQRAVSYAEDIVPIFRGYCMGCHQPGGQGYQASGFDLTTYESLMRGTRFGRMVIPGEPDMSNIVQLIEGRAQMRMPYGHRPLPNCLRQEIWSWIFQGARNN